MWIGKKNFNNLMSECYVLMKDGLVRAFESMILDADLEGALNFISVIYNEIPPPSLISDVIFKILMVNCEEGIANQANAYLVNFLKLLPPKGHGLKYDYHRALQGKDGCFQDIWTVFSHLVESSIHQHRNCSSTQPSLPEIVNYPNFEILIDFYAQVLTKFLSVECVLFEENADERFPIFLGWINQYYKHSIQMFPVCQTLHNLLDHKVNFEVLSDAPENKTEAFNQPILSYIVNAILNNCPDVFNSLEGLRGFLAKSDLPYLRAKICQHMLHEMIYKEKLASEKQSPFTLKTIIYDYFFFKTQNVEIRGKIGQYPKVKEKKKKATTRNSKQLPFLEKNTTDNTQLHVLCRDNKYGDLYGALITESNLDLNAKNSAGYTPLHEACLSKSFYCARFLLEATEGIREKADANATDNNGLTPLHCAVLMNDQEIVKLLLNKRGAELVKCKDNFGKKALTYAKSKGMEKLLEKVEASIQTPPAKSNSDFNMTNLIIPTMKDQEEYYIYLYGLHAILSFYFSNFNLHVTKKEVSSHKDLKCYHYVSTCNMICDEDVSIVETLPQILDYFLDRVKCDAKNIHVNVNQLFHLEVFRQRLY